MTPAFSQLHLLDLGERVELVSGFACKKLGFYAALGQFWRINAGQPYNAPVRQFKGVAVKTVRHSTKRLRQRFCTGSIGISPCAVFGNNFCAVAQLPHGSICRHAGRCRCGLPGIVFAFLARNFRSG